MWADMQNAMLWENSALCFYGKPLSLTSLTILLEVSQYGGIVQCRGYRNNVVQNGGEDKPQEIKDFEQKYQRYLDMVFAEKRKECKTA